MLFQKQLAGKMGIHSDLNSNLWNANRAVKDSERRGGRGDDAMQSEIMNRRGQVKRAAAQGRLS